MDEKEKEALINEILERFCLKIPEIIGNLMTSQASLNKMNSELYSNHQEFRKNKPLVAAVLEEVEGNNPGKEYKDIIKKAIPIIEERMKITNNMDVSNIKDRDKLSLSYNGDI